MVIFYYYISRFDKGQRVDKGCTVELRVCHWIEMMLEVPTAKQLNWLKINPRHADQLHDARPQTICTGCYANILLE